MTLYRDASSFSQHLHPVTKLVLLLLLVIIPFLLSSVQAMLLLLAGMITLLLFSGGAANLRRFGKMLVIFWAFTFVMWIAIPHLRHIPWSYQTAAFLATRVDVLML